MVCVIQTNVYKYLCFVVVIIIYSNSEVLSNSNATDVQGNSGLGDFAGKGIAVDNAHSRTEFFEEHGYYMTLLSVIPDNGYCRGMQRSFFKKNIFDFASPEFNNIGWQDVLNGELFCDGFNDKGTWGYQPRYSEYRSHPSRCTGDFRGDNVPELAWHLNRNFAALPPLNDNFLKVSEFNRIFSAQDLTAKDCRYTSRQRYQELQGKKATAGMSDRELNLYFAWKEQQEKWYEEAERLKRLQAIGQNPFYTEGIGNDANLSSFNNPEAPAYIPNKVL
ncbi:unnamed protein product [Cylicocyclus nassatus]|uniref:Uncharacterized protein n=1 Tax=Cylicocyclus nassatus TaxID=53992 RepID=A0AA36DU92_CYLNA|nr:unnamed protein product [Cylicocyclus nassatus]